MLFPKKLAARITQSAHRFCLTAAHTPSGTEITMVRTIVTAVSSSVAGSLDTNVGNTSCPET